MDRPYRNKTRWLNENDYMFDEPIKETVSEKLTARTTDHTIDQLKENEAKYGPKQYDIISDAYRIGKREGDVYCGQNAKKYVTRYISNSNKAGNAVDLKKAIDYLTRMLEVSTVKPEVIEK